MVKYLATDNSLPCSVRLPEFFRLLISNKPLSPSCFSSVFHSRTSGPVTARTSPPPNPKFKHPTLQMASCLSHHHRSLGVCFDRGNLSDRLLHSISEPALPLPPFLSFLFSVIHSLENLNFHAPISFCTNHLENFLTWMSQTTSLSLAGLLGATEKTHTTGKISTLP